MRFILSMSVLVLHAAIVIAASAPGSIVFPGEFGSHRPSNPVTSLKPSGAAEYGRKAVEAATESTNAFSRRFYQEVAKEETGNLICSPISASLIMSMLSYGAVGETNRQMRDALELPKDEFLAKLGSRLLVDHLNDYKKDNLKVANKIYLDVGMSPKPDFMHIVRNVFRSEVQSIDMSRAVSASSTINRWCEDQTSGLIKNMVNPEYFKSPVVSLLLNAVYFKGTWLTQFDREFTQKRPFYVDGVKATDVESMYVEGEFRFGRLPKVASAFIELPYKSEDNKHNVSMFVILPYRRDGLAHLEANFDKVNIGEIISSGWFIENIRVFLPKFKIESKIELAEPLKRMGMEKAFEDPDFSGFVDNKKIEINKVLQKAFIEVDEFGSQAAAATDADFLDRMGPATFQADHPFIAVIATTGETPLTLFTARYTGPE